MQVNRLLGTDYPETGYRVTYHGVPQSAQERAAQRQHLLELLDAGLIDMVSAYQDLHPGTTDEEAMQALQRIQAIREQIAAAGSTGGPEPTPADSGTDQEVSDERDV